MPSGNSNFTYHGRFIFQKLSAWLFLMKDTFMTSVQKKIVFRLVIISPVICFSLYHLSTSIGLSECCLAMMESWLLTVVKKKLVWYISWAQCLCYIVCTHIVYIETFPILKCYFERLRVILISKTNLISVTIVSYSPNLNQLYSTGH